MATVGAFVDAVILVDGNDLSADMNEVSVDNSVVANGYYNSGSGLADETLFDLLGDTDTVVTVYGEGVDEGNFNGGFSVLTVQSEYSFGGGVGEMLSFNATFESQE